jgi:hypothetical protein
MLLFLLVIAVMIRKLTTLDQLFNEKMKIAIKNEGLAKLKTEILNFNTRRK